MIIINKVTGNILPSISAAGYLLNIIKFNRIATYIVDHVILYIDSLPRLKPWDSLEGGCHHHTV